MRLKSIRPDKRLCARLKCLESMRSVARRASRAGVRAASLNCEIAFFNGRESGMSREHSCIRDEEGRWMDMRRIAMRDAQGYYSLLPILPKGSCACRIDTRPTKGIDLALE